MAFVPNQSQLKELSNGERHSPELKAFAIAQRNTGHSLRATQQAIIKQFGTYVSIPTLSVWSRENGQDPNAGRLEAIAEQRVRIAELTGDNVERIIEEGKLKDENAFIAFGIAADKLDNMLKLAEQRSANAQRETVLAALKQLRELPAERHQDIIAKLLTDGD